MVGKLNILQGERHRQNIRDARSIADGFGEYAIKVRLNETWGPPQRRYEFVRGSDGWASQVDMMGTRLDFVRLDELDGTTGFPDASIEWDFNAAAPHTTVDRVNWRVEGVWTVGATRHRLIYLPTALSGRFECKEAEAADLFADVAALPDPLNTALALRIRIARVGKMSWAVA